MALKKSFLNQKDFKTKTKKLNVMHAKNQSTAVAKHCESMESGNQGLLSVAEIKNGAKTKSHTSSGNIAREGTSITG